MDSLVAKSSLPASQVDSEQLKTINITKAKSKTGQEIVIVQDGRNMKAGQFSSQPNLQSRHQKRKRLHQKRISEAIKPAL